jgi:carbon-monoxide dehydrogenase medium subunit
MPARPVVSRRLGGFGHLSASSVEEAIAVLHQHEGGSLLAGGTDLLALMKLGVEEPDCLVNLKEIPGLDAIREENGVLEIGALARIRSILSSPLVEQKCRALHESTLDFGTPAIRNMATIGGNICRSSPSADTVPSLIACDAELGLVGRGGQRAVPVVDFFTGPGQNVLDREVLTEIRVPLPEAATGSAFAKLNRASSDLAKVNGAVAIRLRDGRCDEVRIALGAVADRPIRARAAEQVLRGMELDDRRIEAALEKVAEDIAPISDVRSTARYRSRVAGVLVGRLIRLAAERARLCESTSP